MQLRTPLAPEPVDWARLKEWDRLRQLLTSSSPAGTAPSYNINAADSVGRTALHYCAGYGERSAALELIRRGALVNAGDRFGATPLHWACLKAHAPLVDLLLAHAADPFVTATAGVFSGRSALDLASRAESSDSASNAVTEALTSALGASLFEQRKVLGRGGFGTVIKAVRRDTGVTVALKEVRKREASGEVNLDGGGAGGGGRGSGGGAGGGGGDLGGGRAAGEKGKAGAADSGPMSVALRGALVEREVLSAVRHPFVVSLHCAYQTTEHLYLAIDYCGGGDLALHIRQSTESRFPEATARFVCSELLLALEAIHEAGVIHRDIKTENVLVDSSGHIRLADMNAAKRSPALAQGGRTYSVVGTPHASAPEVLLGRGYTTAADYWSYGVLLFECVAGRPPYPADMAHIHAHARVVHEVVHGERADLPDDGKQLSTHCVALIDGLLSRDDVARLQRPTALRAHPFFAGVRWAVLLAKQMPSPLLPRLWDRQQRAAEHDVFDYPSVLHWQAGGGPQAPIRDLDGDTGGGLADWDYVMGEGEGSKGARLWRRVRARLDQLSRLQGVSRHDFLVSLLMTLAANAATGQAEDNSALSTLDFFPASLGEQPAPP